MQKQMHKICDSKQGELESTCKQHGLALTIQRRIILENLVSRTDHPTADEVFESVSARMKGVSRTTVYRVLDTFVSIGIAKKVSSPQSTARYDADMTRHHHMTCQRCSRVLDLFDGNLNNLQLPSGIEKEFKILDYSITFTGLCAACNEAVRGQPDKSST